jgi:hypothetical protein
MVRLELSSYITPRKSLAWGRLRPYNPLDIIPLKGFFSDAPGTTLLASTLALLAGMVARADIVTFEDVNGVVGISTTGTAFVVYESTGVVDSDNIVGIFAPAGGTFKSSTLPIYPISATLGFPDLQYADIISNPSGSRVSDILALSTDPNSPSTFPLSPLTPFPAPLALFFESGNPVPSVLCADAPHGCNATYNGMVQTAGTITWELPTGGTFVDTIRYQVISTPEPSSFQLMLVLVMLSGFLVRKAATLRRQKSS